VLIGGRFCLSISAIPAISCETLYFTICSLFRQEKRPRFFGKMPCTRGKNTRLHKPGIFPHECLHDYRNRTEALRALANRDLLRLFAGREDQDAARFSRG
jgi:hypothetical protein